MLLLWAYYAGLEAVIAYLWVFLNTFHAAFYDVMQGAGTTGGVLRSHVQQDMGDAINRTLVIS